jgi:hypothetical protein
MGPRGNQRLDVLQPAVEELPNRKFCRFDIKATAQFRNKTRAFNLRLTLSAREAMPLPAASAGSGISHIDNDRPVARRAFADVPLHDGPIVFSSFNSFFRVAPSKRFRNGQFVDSIPSSRYPQFAPPRQALRTLLRLPHIAGFRLVHRHQSRGVRRHQFRRARNLLAGIQVAFFVIFLPGCVSGPILRPRGQSQDVCGAKRR